MTLKTVTISTLRHLRDCNLDTKIVVLLIAIVLTRGAMYAMISPPFSAPDEKGHYDYLASLYENGGSPFGNVVQGKEHKQSPLYYVLSMPMFAAFAGQTSDIDVYALTASQVSLLSLVAVRYLSVLLTAATVPIAYWTAKTVCPQDKFVYLGTAAFVALMPAYGWTGASINNDNLARLLTSAIILLLVQGISRGFTRANCLGLVALAAVGLATKPTTLPVAAVVPVVVAVKVAYGRVGPRTVAGVLAAAAAVFGLLLASPLGSALLDRLAVTLKPWISARGLLSVDSMRIFLGKLDVWPFVYQFKSFWGSFSMDSIPLPATAYWLAAAITSAAMLGLFIRTVRVFVNSPARKELLVTKRRFAGQILVLAGLVLLQWILSFGRFYGNDPSSPAQRIAGWDEDFALMQGRFLFPVMIPIAFLFFWGLRALLPPAWVKNATWVTVTLLLLMDWVALGTLASGGHSWQTYSGQG